MPFCHVSLRAQKLLPKAYPRELKTFGDQLRKRRLDLNLLQKEVAERIGVDKASVYNWENNRSSPQLHYMPKIIESLGYVPFETEAGILAEGIVSCRRAQGITQEELARRLRYDPSLLHNLAAPIHRPELEIWPKSGVFEAELI